MGSVDAIPVQAKINSSTNSIAPTGICIPEVEPNNAATVGGSMLLPSTPIRVRADLFIAPFTAGVDVDHYRITAAPGDRIFAATMTGFSGGSTDTLLDVLDSTGAVLETDDEDGTVSGSASNIGGLVLVTGGTYYIRVRQFSTTSLSGTIRPYDLYVQLLSGAPTPEVEPNNNGGTPNLLPANGWISGAIGVAADNDTFSLTGVNAGDTIVVITDVDPERDAPEWNDPLYRTL